MIPNAFPGTLREPDRYFDLEGLFGLLSRSCRNAHQSVCALSVSGMMHVIVWSSLFVICGSVFFGGQESAVSGTFDF